MHYSLLPSMVVEATIVGIFTMRFFYKKINYGNTSVNLMHKRATLTYYSLSGK